MKREKVDKSIWYLTRIDEIKKKIETKFYTVSIIGLPLHIERFYEIELNKIRKQARKKIDKILVAELKTLEDEFEKL